ncbi:MAG: MgtC/SapB family protein [bacterium]|nr:MgtC/SapB family protein [bacterium]
MSELLLNIEDLLRLTAAMLLGAAIGFERELHDKPAGLKTIALVTLAGALLSLLSIKLGLLASGGAEAVDISRLAAGVVTGIGFIGAGTIIQSRHRVEGVTTAAIIWLMSAVGMCIGAGFFGIAIGAYILGWVALSLDPLGVWLMKKFKLRQKVQKAEAYEQAVKQGNLAGQTQEEQPSLDTKD